MKILQILRAPVGGLFRHVSDLTKGLDAAGHEVAIVVDELSKDSQTDEKLAALAPHAQLGIHEMPIPRLFGAADLTTPFKIRGLVRALDIDIVHGHGAKGGFHARLGALGLNANAFYTPHGGALHFSSRSPAGFVFHRLEKLLVRASTKIIFESAYAQKTYNRAIADVGTRGVVIHNGLDEAEFTPIPSDNSFDFVFVGELRDLKGIAYLLEAFATLCTRTDKELRLLMIGDGPHREMFETQARELGIAANVTFAGAKPAVQGFAHAENVIVPSLKESLPYIVMEAIAAGKHVIATNVGGIPEIYGPCADELIPAADSNALLEKMSEALARSAQEQPADRRLFEHVHQEFVTSQMVSSILAQYESAQ
ncbi:glycosyltransferase [Maritalea myrionectae]|uniref:glycosyltransferase n=1 Tax=Maritalea myrionectae TaxID=454601 RepID=UPI0004009D9B|nr:glycosyltransferase [Maritalea myrionectae]